MSVERRELKSWRERSATLLKGPGDEIPEQPVRQNDKTGQNPDLLLVGSVGEAPETVRQNPVMSDKTPTNDPLDVRSVSGVTDRPRLFRVGPTTWKEAEWASGLCVFCSNELAEGDVITCIEHRGKIDQIVMPWDLP